MRNYRLMTHDNDGKDKDGRSLKGSVSEDGGTRKRAFDLLAPPIATCLIVAVGLILSNAKGEWLDGVLIVAIAVSVSTIVALLVSQWHLRQMEQVVATRLAEAVSAQLMRPDGVGEVWTQVRLSEWERVADVETVWIVGENFGSEIEVGSPFRDVVRDNIDRGVDYVYLAPEKGYFSPGAQLNALRRAMNIEEDDARLRILPLDEEQWKRLPYTAGNVTIYDPHSSRPIGYFWYPGLDGKSFGRLGDNIAVTWAAQIEEVCPELGEGC
jgi:hypothetical protein